MYDPDEIWQINIDGKVYETSFHELKSWISDGSLQRQDKVRRKDLRWLEAGRVPDLIRHFDRFQPQKKQGRKQSRGTHGSRDVHETEQNSVHVTNSQRSDESEPETAAASGEAVNVPETCGEHRDTPARYLCVVCQVGYCLECVDHEGKDERSCPLCGSFPLIDLNGPPKKAIGTHLKTEVTRSLGISDLLRALAMPLNSKREFIFSITILLILVSATVTISWERLPLSLIGLVILTFLFAMACGVLVNTVTNIARGNKRTGFLSERARFTLLSDLVEPLALGIAILVSSFGVFSLVMVGGISYVVSSNTLFEESAKQMSSVPAALTGAKQSDSNTRNSARSPRPARSEIDYNSNKELTELQRRNRQDLIDLYRSGPSGLTAGPLSRMRVSAREAISNENVLFRNVALSLIRLPDLFWLTAGICFLWGLFYLPVACAVAGYSRSLVATINPFRGLLIMWELGIEYFKLLSCLAFFVLALGGLFWLSQSLFPSRSVSVIWYYLGLFAAAVITFYFLNVSSAVIGIVLFKNSLKLRLG